jgi:hypothetical protein
MPILPSDIESAHDLDKPYKLHDTGGLFLLVATSGGKHWRFKYRFAGKENQLTLGSYPEVTLIEARVLRDAAKKLLAEGIDPSVARREAKARQKLDQQESKAVPIFRLSMTLDGKTEVWKGRSVIRLTAEETRALHTMLTKFLD